jgi:hypothetical protein
MCLEDLPVEEGEGCHLLTPATALRDEYVHDHEAGHDHADETKVHEQLDLRTLLIHASGRNPSARSIHSHRISGERSYTIHEATSEAAIQIAAAIVA